MAHENGPPKFQLLLFGFFLVDQLHVFRQVHVVDGVRGDGSFFPFLVFIPTPVLVSSAFPLHAFFTPVSVVRVRQVVLFNFFSGWLPGHSNSSCAVCIGLVLNLDVSLIFLFAAFLIREVTKNLRHVIFVLFAHPGSLGINASAKALPPCARVLQRLIFTGT